MNEKKVLVINRPQWLRGQGSYQSRLLDWDGRMCCLGFDALACGLTNDDIRGISSPWGVGVDKNTRTKYPDYFLTRTGLVVLGSPTREQKKIAGQVARLMRINDFIIGAGFDSGDGIITSEEEREKLIREGLMELGYEDVVFTDEPLPPIE